MTKEAAFSLADLNVVAASETPFDVEYIKPDGTGSGVILKVLGSNSAKVTEATNRLLNDRRKREANLAALTGQDFTPIESDIEFGHLATAVKLVGWTGIVEPYTEANALLLVKTNPHLAKQVNDAANGVGNFLQLKPKV